METDFSDTDGSGGPRHNTPVIRSVCSHSLPWSSTNKTGHEWAGRARVCRPKDSPRGRRERGAPPGATPIVWEKDCTEGTEKKVVHF